MSRVYIGNLDPRISERELEDEFRVFGVIRSVWVSRKPPGYAFVDFDDRRDATDAIRELDGKNGWRVEMSHGGSGSGRGGRSGSGLKCYQCGEPGHYARECSRAGSGRRRSGSRSPPPRYRRSPQKYRSSPSYGGRSYSPRGRPTRRSPSPRATRRSPSPRATHRSPSPRATHRSPSPRATHRSPSPRGRSYSRSPYRGRDEATYANGNGANEKRWSRSRS